MIFSVVIGAVSTVAGILIAQFIGAEETKEAWCSFDVSLICGIVISALFLLAAGVFPSQILGLYTKDMDIINTGLNYLLIFGKLGFSCMGIKSQSRIVCGCLQHMYSH